MLLVHRQMAGRYSGCEQTTQFCEISVLNQSFTCKSCIEYKAKSGEITQELLTSKEIIQLLQEDLNKYRDLNSSIPSKISPAVAVHK